MKRTPFTTCESPDQPLHHYRVRWLSLTHGAGSSTNLKCCEAHLREHWIPGELGLRITQIEDLGLAPDPIRAIRAIRG